MGRLHFEIINRMDRPLYCCESCGYEYDEPERRNILDLPEEKAFIEEYQDCIVVSGEVSLCPMCGNIEGSEIVKETEG